MQIRGGSTKQLEDSPFQVVCGPVYCERFHCSDSNINSKYGKKKKAIGEAIGRTKRTKSKRKSKGKSTGKNKGKSKTT